jgi:hypothetical protein
METGTHHYDDWYQEDGQYDPDYWDSDDGIAGFRPDKATPHNLRWQEEWRIYNASQYDRDWYMRGYNPYCLGDDKKYYQEVKRKNPNVKWSKRYRDNILQKHGVDLWQ